MRLIYFISFLFVFLLSVNYKQKVFKTSESHSSFAIQEIKDQFLLSSVCPKGLLPSRGKCIVSLNTVMLPESNAGVGQNIKELTLDPKKIDLGRFLFFDPILSGANDISCAHCHHPAYSLSDGRETSNGYGGHGVGPQRVGGAELKRAAPSLWNVGLMKSFFWDGRAKNLGDQMEGPLYSPDEMGSNPEKIIGSLNANLTYVKLFKETFGKQGINMDQVKFALSEFESSLISLNSRFDKWTLGDKKQLNETELLGYNVYRSFVARCSECHTPPLFTNGVFAIIGVPDKNERDIGREKITGQVLLRGSFRIPSIRNITKTAPYMHSGVFASLSEVIDFYNAGGGRSISSQKDLRIHWHVRNMEISEREKMAILSFLDTLTDESAMPAVPSRVPSGLPVIIDVKKR